MRPWRARDSTNRRRVLHQIWGDKIHNCRWSVKTTTLIFYSPDTCALPCLPHLPSAPLHSLYLHSFSLVSTSFVPPVWDKGVGSGFAVCSSRLHLSAGSNLLTLLLWSNFVVLQTEDEDENSLMDSADFGHCLVCAWWVCWCKHKGRWGPLAQGHCETSAWHCQYCGQHQHPF